MKKKLAILIFFVFTISLSAQLTHITVLMSKDITRSTLNNNFSICNAKLNFPVTIVLDTRLSNFISVMNGNFAALSTAFGVSCMQLNYVMNGALTRLTINDNFDLIATSSLFTTTYTYDADALAYINAVGLIDTADTYSTNRFVVGLKTDGLWTKMYAIYPFMGITKIQHSYNLVNPAVTNGAYYLTWTDPTEYSYFATHHKNGVKWNQGNQLGYADTHLDPSLTWTTNESIGVYVTDSINTSVALEGVEDAIGAAAIFSGRSTNYLGGYLGNSACGTKTGVLDAGVRIASRTGFSNQLFYNDGIQLFYNTGLILQSLNTPSGTFILGAERRVGGIGANTYNKSDASLYFISSGLDATQSLNMTNRIKAYKKPELKNGVYWDYTNYQYKENFKPDLSGSLQVFAQAGNYKFGSTKDSLYYSIDCGETYPKAYRRAFSGDTITMAFLYDNGVVQYFTSGRHVFQSKDRLATVTELIVKNKTGVAGNYTFQAPPSGGQFNCVNQPFSYKFDGIHEVALFGNYCNWGGPPFSHGGASEVLLYSCYIDSVKIAYRFGLFGNPVQYGDATNPIIIKHVHGVSLNPVNKHVVVFTGDAKVSTYWMDGTYNYNTDVWSFSTLVDHNTSAKHKIGGLVFVGDSAIWGTDANDYGLASANGIWKCKISEIGDTTKYVRKVDIGNSFLLGAEYDGTSKLIFGHNYMSNDNGLTFHQYAYPDIGTGGYNTESFSYKQDTRGFWSTKTSWYIPWMRSFQIRVK